MGNKVHPVSFRLNKLKNWTSLYYSNKNYSDSYNQDLLIKKFLINFFYSRNISLSNIYINKNLNKEIDIFFNVYLLKNIFNSKILSKKLNKKSFFLRKYKKKNFNPVQVNFQKKEKYFFNNYSIVLPTNTNSSVNNLFINNLILKKNKTLFLHNKKFNRFFLVYRKNRYRYIFKYKFYRTFFKRIKKKFHHKKNRNLYIAELNSPIKKKYSRYFIFKYKKIFYLNFLLNSIKYKVSKKKLNFQYSNYKIKKNKLFSINLKKSKNILEFYKNFINLYLNYKLNVKQNLLLKYFSFTKQDQKFTVKRRKSVFVKTKKKFQKKRIFVTLPSKVFLSKNIIKFNLFNKNNSLLHRLNVLLLKKNKLLPLLLKKNTKLVKKNIKIKSRFILKYFNPSKKKKYINKFKSKNFSKTSHSLSRLSSSKKTFKLRFANVISSKRKMVPQKETSYSKKTKLTLQIPFIRKKKKSFYLNKNYYFFLLIRYNVAYLNKIIHNIVQDTNIKINWNILVNQKNSINAQNLSSYLKKSLSKYKHQKKLFNPIKLIKNKLGIDEFFYLRNIRIFKSTLLFYNMYDLNYKYLSNNNFINKNIKVFNLSKLYTKYYNTIFWNKKFNLLNKKYFIENFITYNINSKKKSKYYYYKLNVSKKKKQYFLKKNSISSNNVSYIEKKNYQHKKMLLMQQKLALLNNSRHILNNIVINDNKYNVLNKYNMGVLNKKNQLQNNESFLLFKQLFNKQYYNLVKGFQVNGFGRLGSSAKSTRSNITTYKIGTTLKNSLNLNIDYYSDFAITRNGSYGLKVLKFYKVFNLKKYLNNLYLNYYN